MAHEPDSDARWLMEQWTAALATAIESMTEERPQVEFAPAGSVEAGTAKAEPATTAPATAEPATAEPATAAPPTAELATEALCWEQGYRDIPQPALWVTAAASTWMELGGRSLRAAGIDTAEPADSRNTFLEILSQSLAVVAQSLSAKLGREVAPESGVERQHAGPAAYTFTATVSYADAALPLEVALTAGLMRALATGAGETAAEDAAGLLPLDLAGAARGAPGALEISGSPVSPNPVSPNMDLLLDVELAVSVSFGRTELPIKEILKLTTGSIVELNRSLSEPVEVIVNNCVVARGEVVVIDGNYGVRIQQIISRQDRLRSLR